MVVDRRRTAERALADLVVVERPGNEQEIGGAFHALHQKVEILRQVVLLVVAQAAVDQELTPHHGFQQPQIGHPPPAVALQQVVGREAFRPAGGVLPQSIERPIGVLAEQILVVRHQFGTVFFRLLEQHVKPLRLVPIVRIEKRDPLALRGGDAGIAGGARAGIACIDDDSHARIRGGQFRKYLVGVVAGRVVDGDQFEIPTGLIEYGLDRAPNGVRPIVTGHDHRDAHHRLGSHIAGEGAKPIWFGPPHRAATGSDDRRHPRFRPRAIARSLERSLPH